MDIKKRSLSMRSIRNKLSSMADRASQPSSPKPGTTLSCKDDGMPAPQHSSRDCASQPELKEDFVAENRNENDGGMDEQELTKYLQSLEASPHLDTKTFTAEHAAAAGNGESDNGDAQAISQLSERLDRRSRDEERRYRDEERRSRSELHVSRSSGSRRDSAAWDEPKRKNSGTSEVLQNVRAEAEARLARSRERERHHAERAAALQAKANAAKDAHAAAALRAAAAAAAAVAAAEKEQAELQAVHIANLKVPAAASSSDSEDAAQNNDEREKYELLDLSTDVQPQCNEAEQPAPLTAALTEREAGPSHGPSAQAAELEQAPAPAQKEVENASKEKKRRAVPPAPPQLPRPFVPLPMNPMSAPTQPQRVERPFRGGG